MLTITQMFVLYQYVLTTCVVGYDFSAIYLSWMNPNLTQKM